ncbi:sodium channel modifier 1 [Xenopus laevis]|uniref:Sodium channel modifier 1 n=2 Tax=Xenopus laevis TaxID=8355 RepID=SCNM1_XENLA|nr:sodium channel modifier 1 [Xenopus laevis]Q3KQ71.1 RecName: Full=Sodium channel modifier 1 [Xenopus laevis]AAI06359.1 MGC130906 protein [Xenopus laevis]OCT69335.1 hypothetical protein XELAEV_18040650mg [Xenopus laevis]
MSFKRDGDDSSQLNVLKKRRVADLLASYIPEDEALLLKNGSYACTVCHHRPVFNTIDMLSVHRTGKKHLGGLQRYYGKKLEHKNEIQKRRHFDFVRAEDAGEKPPPGPAPLLVQTKRITQNALLKSAPYNSCCSNKKVVANSRNVYDPHSGPSTTTGLNVPLDTQPGPSQPHTSLHSPPTGPCSSPTDEIPPNKNNSRHKKKGEEKFRKEIADPERERNMEHYLQLKSSGWIPDGTGKWVKDENVEFDSDEEEPPALPPS